MNVFSYRGKRTSDFQVTVSGEATWNKPRPIYERTTVPGRNGEIVTFTGAYENVPIMYRCGITRETNARYQAFVNHLLASPGYNRLEDTYHPDYYRLAMVESVGEPSLSRFYRVAEFEVEFTCKPQTFLKSGDHKRTYTSNGKIYNPTLFDAKPLLRVWGTGEFIIANDTVRITSADVYTDIDCESENAYKDNGGTNCNGNIVLSGDSFPVIPKGEHGITLNTGITKIEIIPRWWQL